MNGQQIGKIRIKRQLRLEHRSIFDTITIEKAQQLFNRKIHLCWKENGVQKKVSENVIKFWLKSPQLRKEIYYTPVQTELRHSPMVAWLGTHVMNDPYLLSPVRFGQLNERAIIYETFLAEVNETDGWNPKKISNEFYHFFPQSKPRKNTRVRKNGIACIYIPNREHCEEIFAKLQSCDINLIF